MVALINGTTLVDLCSPATSSNGSSYNWIRQDWKGNRHPQLSQAISLPSARVHAAGGGDENETLWNRYVKVIDFIDDSARHQGNNVWLFCALYTCMRTSARTKAPGCLAKTC